MPHFVRSVAAMLHLRILQTDVLCPRLSFPSSLLVAWCLAMSDDKCAICRETMLESDDRFALQCGHVYHQCCIECYAEVKKVHIADLPCPKCKSTSHDLRMKEEAVIIQDVDDGHPYTAAGYLAATEATQNEDTSDVTGEGAATDTAQKDQDMGDATPEGAATEAATEAAQKTRAMHSTSPKLISRRWRVLPTIASAPMSAPRQCRVLLDRRAMASKLTQCPLGRTLDRRAMASKLTQCPLGTTRM